LAGALQNGRSEAARRHAVWGLTRLEGENARQSVRSALEDPSESVRHAAIHSLALWRDGQAVSGLIAQLGSPSIHLRRVAAEALGRIGDSSAVPSLLKTGPKTDRVLEHSIIFALIEIGDSEATAKGLESSDSLTRRAAMIALDQIPGNHLGAEQVTPLLASNDEVLKETASWIVSRRQEWGDALGGYFQERLSGSALDETGRNDLQRQLSFFGRNPAVQLLIGEALSKTELKGETRLLVLRAMAASRVRELPEIWISGLTAAIQSADIEVVSQAVRTLRSLPAPKKEVPGLKAALLEAARHGAFPPLARLQALVVAPGINEIENDLFQFLCAHLAPEKEVQLRSAAAGALSRSKLTPEQLDHLAEVIQWAGPLELPQLLAAFENGSEEALGLKLINSLRQSSSVSILREELLSQPLKNYPAAVREAAEALLISLEMDTRAQRAHLEQLLDSLPSGDIRRGQAIFNGPQAACSTCHAIGAFGGNYGPDLTSIGTIRTRFDLLESIVYPSASIARSYETIIVQTSSGEDYTGILKRDAPDEVVLATGPGMEVRLPRNEIADIRPGTISIMPGGLHEQLNPQELADLLDFLKSTRWGPQPAAQ
jgi:putative heme-binding domain-containing protein